MKIIDLLNKIANGEEVPKKIRINGWCYKFEWQDYAGNYLDESEEIDLMSALSCDKEELNKEVEILDDEDEEKKIPENNFNYIYSCEDEHIMANFENIKTTLKDIIDYLKSKGE